MLYVLKTTFKTMVLWKAPHTDSNTLAKSYLIIVDAFIFILATESGAKPFCGD